MLGLSFLGETSNIDKIVVGDIFVEGLEQEARLWFHFARAPLSN